MRLRTFSGATIAEAMQTVRAEMGDDAVIVSSVKGRAGIEVTAVLETKSPRPGAPLPDIETLLEKSLRARLRRDTLAAADDDAATSDAPSGVPFDLGRLTRALAAHGTPQQLADALTDAAQAMDTDDAIRALAGALETRFGFEPIPLEPPAPVMLVGLPGSGKTSTMAKLAARSVLAGGGVELMTMDTARTGAIAQTNAYGDLLRHGVRPVETVEELALALDARAERAALQPHSAGPPCFIDTPSINPFDDSEMAKLNRFVETARAGAKTEPVLVLSAAGDPRVMAEAAAAFAQIGVRRMIATQIDIARRVGSALAAADMSGLALAQAGITPYLARGLTALNPATCAQLILGESKREGGECAAAPSAMEQEKSA